MLSVGDFRLLSVGDFMQIDFAEAQKWLWSNTEKYRMHRLKKLFLSSVKSVELLYRFLYRMPNLEKLKLAFGGDLFKELVPSAKIAPQKRLGRIGFGALSNKGSRI
ncbi:hypothetical protein CR513_29320, partial [Mucuna pruriens]